MSINAANRHAALSDQHDEQKTAASLATHQHDHHHIGDMPATAASSSTHTQIDAEYECMRAELELLTMQQRNHAMRAQLVAARSHTPITPSLYALLITLMTATYNPASAPSFKPLKHNPPDKFNGKKGPKAPRVENWIAEVQLYFEACSLPADRYVFETSTLFSDRALEWYSLKRQEVAAQSKVMTWEWLAQRLIEDFGQSQGQLTEEAEWFALKMGTKGTDGTETGENATYTVKDYSDRFVRLMQTLVKKTPATTDLMVIHHYCAGIENGYPSLWTEMKNGHAVARYATLSEAITAAGLAEINLSIRHQESHHHDRRSRHHTQVNHMQSNSRGDDSPTPSPPRSPSTKRRVKKPTSSTLTANGFVFKPVTGEGRFRLTESQQKSLYDQNRCYHCYQPFHPNMKSCPIKMTEAPGPLNA